MVHRVSLKAVPLRLRAKPLSISLFYQVPGQDYTNVILMPPKNLTSKVPVLFETVLFIPTCLMCAFLKSC